VLTDSSSSFSLSLHSEKLFHIPYPYQRESATVLHLSGDRDITPLKVPEWVMSSEPQALGLNSLIYGLYL
jgi:hypothetical protein